MQTLFVASNVLSDIAHAAARHSNRDPDANYVCTLFSAAWFEGSLNEAILDLAEGGYREPSSRIHRVRLAAKASGLKERAASVERKLRVLCAAAMEAELDMSRDPWKSVLLLFRLRNWMVHLRPELIQVRPGKAHERSTLVNTKIDPLVTALLDVGAVRDVPNDVLVSIASAMQLPGVGRWAYRTAYAGLSTVDEWLPERLTPLLKLHKLPE